MIAECMEPPSSKPCAAFFRRAGDALGKGEFLLAQIHPNIIAGTCWCCGQRLHARRFLRTVLYPPQNHARYRSVELTPVGGCCFLDLLDRKKKRRARKQVNEAGLFIDRRDTTPPRGNERRRSFRGGGVLLLQWHLFRPFRLLRDVDLNDL